MRFDEPAVTRDPVLLPLMARYNDPPIGPDTSPFHKYRPECGYGLNLGFSYFPAVPVDRFYSGSFDPITPDCWYTRPEFKTDDFTRRKTGLYIPIWEADRFLNDLEHVDREIQHIHLKPGISHQKNTPRSPQFSPRFPVPGGFPALIRERCTRLFEENPEFQPV